MKTCLHVSWLFKKSFTVHAEVLVASPHQVKCVLVLLLLHSCYGLKALCLHGTQTLCQLLQVGLLLLRHGLQHCLDCMRWTTSRGVRVQPTILWSVVLCIAGDCFHLQMGKYSTQKTEHEVQFTETSSIE